MTVTRTLKTCLTVSLLTVLMGCATTKNYDYTTFRQHPPRSILVLPPLNESPEVEVTYSVLSTMTYPLAESGYYVLPVTLVDETFKQNGLHGAGDIHTVAPQKLHEIFGADAALYVTINQYGTSYLVIDSIAQVTANARLVDLKTGETLWAGYAMASSSEDRNSHGGGIIGILLTAVVKQIINTSTDASHKLAYRTSYRLLSAGQPGGMLFGPYSPQYGTD